MLCPGSVNNWSILRFANDTIINLFDRRGDLIGFVLVARLLNLGHPSTFTPPTSPPAGQWPVSLRALLAGIGTTATARMCNLSREFSDGTRPMDYFCRRRSDNSDSSAADGCNLITRLIRCFSARSSCNLPASEST